MISIHALREEGDLLSTHAGTSFVQFLSTPSARRATLRLRQSPGVVVISIHALREEGDAASLVACAGVDISIHALREEGDWVIPACFLVSFNFYPRPPRGGRPPRQRSKCCRRYFYPRPPRGGRQTSLAQSDRASVISIHALREEGDGCAGLLRLNGIISIHALREEGD